MSGLRLVILSLVAGGAAGCAAVPLRATTRLDCDCCAPPGVTLAPFRLAPTASRPPVFQAQKGFAHVG
jgi:hypothetical protein